MRHSNSFKGGEHYKPMKGLVLIEQELLPETTEGGIIRPESVRVQTTAVKTAKVVAVGPDSDVSVGDRIFVPGGGHWTEYPFVRDTSIKHTDMYHYFVREEDCLAIIED